MRYKFLFLEWKFHVKILTSTEVIQKKNVLGICGCGGEGVVVGVVSPIQNRVNTTLVNNITILAMLL